MASRRLSFSSWVSLADILTPINQSLQYLACGLDTLVESKGFLESFSEEPALVQLHLLTVTIKFFMKNPTEGAQRMI
ncbi:beta-adaptin-like protein C [Papaver somniferum]|uniref:beta-adaptin-like protein C n=1 Tax=Papaver somniferum TaxID=3469 RepID=UPI000E6F4A95|nr:beta-adaptin-like protein C [Papaver somniferum]